MCIKCFQEYLQAFPFPPTTSQHPKMFDVTCLLNNQNTLFVSLISEDIHENMHEKIICVILETVLKTIGVASLGQ